ncbi:hypothetical protein, partial [Trichocoleus sp. FACHB-591]|uniref:hypothetical protein n=1 Tax=Trichocoleus sp. FACHB-591 TaxID=2692872 RepID=UPI001A7E5B88
RFQKVTCKYFGDNMKVNAQTFRLYLLLFFLVLGQVILSPASAYAQNQSGDYFQGKLPHYPSEREYVISEWRVITSSGLNCRSDAGTQFRVVKTLAFRSPFNVQTGEGRDQHNNPTKLDSRGLPWFKVAKSSQGAVQCFVRANSRYIEPVIPR